MARRSQHSQQQIKDMVFQAAEAIVREDGFAALKVREIAMEIGYTVGSIYMVFNNMNDLIMQLKERILDEIIQQLLQVSPLQSPEQQLIALAQSYLNFAQCNFNRWSMIFEHRSTANEAIPESYQQKIELIFQKVADLLKQLAPQANAEQCKNASWILGSGVHGVCILSLQNKNHSHHVQEVEKSVTLLVESFMKGWIQTL
jgi:AcrR family transcriptional regulator